jgi:hypothetical protein
MMDQNTIDKVKLLLGRSPRGLRDVVVTSPEGAPQVLRVGAVVDEKPFPTIYWLVDPILQKRIDRLESTGLINKIENEILLDPELAEKVRKDHCSYIELREKFMTTEEKLFLQEKNYYLRLKNRGIGGISNFSKVRCLHMHYAFHLVKPTTIGRMIDQYLV